MVWLLVSTVGFLVETWLVIALARRVTGPYEDEQTRETVHR